ncbi:hypothetical protein PCC8801_2189 [Rippkaea orientalis PCC 8801]|uniref:Uncharacterized protein n=1 Tax=Rippkaea orientalis (strain PCC 8801 / RF-1) TaxID=41431 RepID=B7K070_RIPO1|nr:hypothetical protein PCC8801_2189 [Rippkaea orientalis PCC 8801]
MMKTSFIIALGLATLITSLPRIAEARPTQIIRNSNPGIFRTIIPANTVIGGRSDRGYHHYERQSNYNYSRSYNYERQGNYGDQGYYYRVRQGGYYSREHIIFDQGGRRTCVNC